MTENVPKKESARQHRRSGAAGFQLHKFPKEFEKKLTDEIDGFYLTILLLCLFISISVFGFLSTNAVDFFGLSHDEIAARTQKIIRKIYKIEAVEEEPEPDEVEEDPNEDKADTRKKEIAKRRKQKQNQKVSAAERAQQRREAAARRRSKRQAERARVAGSAQLALITGGVSSGGEAVSDVLGDANTGINLDAALSGTNGVALAGSSSAGTRYVKGGRAGGARSVGDLVGGVSGISSTSLGSRTSEIRFGDVELDENAMGIAGRTKVSINSRLLTIRKAVENCYKKEKRINPSLNGTVVVRFAITKRGQVRKIAFPVNTIANSKVIRCIKTKFRSLRFGSAKRDVKKVEIKYIFN